jgi:TonB-linked SusC/RagA family outer membrane protein
MLKKLLLTVICALFMITAALSQAPIRGEVTDARTGETLPGVNVMILSIQRGTATGIDGQYELIDVPSGTYTLTATYVGYMRYQTEVQVGTAPVVTNISLEPDVVGLDDVVVTAFGLSRAEKSVGYSVQSISGDQVSRTQQGNIVGALAGKVAGAQVIGTSGANIGGSEKIRLRGANGLSDGQPLFVVDGTPISNQSFTLGFAQRGRDFGNMASDLNMENIESISVLKGAAASALYGNRASNGVIMITTKSGAMGPNQPIQVDFSNSTYFDNVYILPEYQNEYAGGYTQDYLEYTDPVDGQQYLGLNYAADESWGPRIDGTTMYRPWWSWFNHDFTGNGQNDYGTTVPMTARPDNVRDFFDTGVRVSNSLSISGGAENASFRISLNNLTQTGVQPNSSLDRTSLSFNGALSHSNRFTSRISVNYTNTQGEGRPTQGYSPLQGSPVQSFNQWFQRQVDMSKLRQYRTADGVPTSWNIRSPTDLRPLYWDSPFFSVNENVATDDRDRIFGNYTMSYNINPNFEAIGKIHLDTYDFIVEDRVASGGLEEDWYYVAQRSRREINFEGGLRYEQNFQDFSVSGYVGANERNERYRSLVQQTVGGLSTPNYFNIAASIDRPSVSNFSSDKKVRSIYGTSTVGFRDLIYVEASLRNDWSSALPDGQNSYLYYGFSTSLVFTEFDIFRNQNILSFGKLRASIAQVGDDIDPYQIYQTFSNADPYGNNPAQTVPNTLPNSALKAAISTDYEFGADLRFLDGRLRTDVSYYISTRENEILQLQVPGSSGFSQATINAGKFETKGWELQLGATAFQTADWNVDFGLNWATSKSEVVELAEGLSTRVLEAAFFGVALYANEGEEWGQLITTGGYGGYTIHEGTGERIVNPNGTYAIQTNKELGSILPDWTGGFRFDVDFRNFSLGTFFEYQKGGQFYSITKMFNAYSGLGKMTVGDNTLGNPLRDPVLDSNGNPVSSVALSNAHPSSGGVYVAGVDADGNPVEYLRQASLHFPAMFLNKEAWLFDASYVKLREVKLTYNLPAGLLANLPIKRANVSVDIQNALMIYSSTSGVDPSIIQNDTGGFSFWEGGTLPGTRTIGFNINLGF